MKRPPRDSASLAAGERLSSGRNIQRSGENPGQTRRKVTRPDEGRNLNLFLIAAIILLVVVFLVARSVDDLHLKTEAANPTEIQGVFTLLLYGSSSTDDLATIAILDKEGDPYSFEIYAPDFAYAVRTGLNAAQALEEAERFVRRNIRTERSRLHRILSPAGAGIGFELRPLYSVTSFGRDDILDVRYSIKDRKVVVRVELDRDIEMQTMN